MEGDVGLRATAHSQRWQRIGNYSTGWSQLGLPDWCVRTAVATTSRDWLTCTAIHQAVGIATASNPCSVGDEPHGCIDVKTGSLRARDAGRRATLLHRTPAAVWDPTANGGKGAVYRWTSDGESANTRHGRLRHQPLWRVGLHRRDMRRKSREHHRLLRWKCIRVTNILGFFGLACDERTGDVIGRLVSFPGEFVTGAPSVGGGASFLMKSFS